MVVFDTNFLLLLLDPDVRIPVDPATSAPLTSARDRVEHLVSTLTQQGETIGIPTPVVAELLVHAGQAGPARLAIIEQSSRFRVLPFDLRAAVEVAAMTSAALRTGDKSGGSTEPWQKMKIDRQIVAIALVGQASAVYSDDKGVVRFARQQGLQAVSSWNLPLPPKKGHRLIDV